MTRVANVMTRTAKAMNRRTRASWANGAAAGFALAPRTARVVIITDAWIGRSAREGLSTPAVYRRTGVAASHGACGARWTSGPCGGSLTSRSGNTARGVIWAGCVRGACGGMGAGLRKAATARTCICSSRHRHFPREIVGPSPG